mmetsp:Transcript_19157/g.40120  ORF Transcript_19157/g.40120 Transcript_19157/m.40120 type:complete len:86 (+) Transcript_19157:1808-2065(+)
MRRSVKSRSVARYIFIGSRMEAIQPIRRPDLAPDQLKYLDVILPQEDSRTSVVILTINNTATVVGKATFVNIIRRTSTMLALYVC